MWAFIDRLNHAPGRVAQGDVDALKAAGWSEEAIYDAVSVCALFNFYNRWIDGTGVSDLGEQGYKMSGERMAENGYV